MVAQSPADFSCVGAPVCFTVRYSVAAKRKLFLTHAGELAHLLIRETGHEGVVAQFVRAYAERHNRQGLLSNPARFLELEATIGREVLLVLAAEVRRLLSQEFPPGRKGVIRPESAAFLEAFYAEFLASLIRGLRWLQADADGETELFRRDLEMYRRWGERPKAPQGAVRADEMQSPFRDRCALLLDPAMMEQARRAAVEFEKQLPQVAAHKFRRLGLAGRVAARSGRRAKKKSAKRGKRPPRRASQPKPRRRTTKQSRQSAAKSRRGNKPKPPGRLTSTRK